MKLDHIGINVSDLPRSVAFYEAALGALGLCKLGEVGGWIGFGGGAAPELWLGRGATQPPQSCHFAFAVPTRAEVDAFYAAGLAAGGSHRDAPRLHPEYHPNFYAAMVFDPDGHNLEVVCHLPQQFSIWQARPRGMKPG